MPPKKKAAQKKNEEEEDMTEKLYKVYRKALTTAGLSMPRKIAEKFNSLREEKQSADLTELAIWDPIGTEGIRAIANALTEVKYDKLKAIFLWEAFAHDDGIRSLCQYMHGASSLRTVEIVNCRMTALGCEFLGTVFSQSAPNIILSLKLDHNDIGDAGMAALAQGLRMNMKLMYLSLAFCNIGSDGGRGLMEILINQGCLLKDLNLQGNSLRNRGVAMVLRGLVVNNSVVSVNLTDNKCSDDSDLMHALKDVMLTNTQLKTLDLTHNNFGDPTGQFVLDLITSVEGTDFDGFAISSLLLPERISHEILEPISKALGKKKKGKKKGKKGKKGKKK